MLTALLVTAGSLPAQALFLPHTQAPQSVELGGASVVPLMTAASRLQVLYDASELNGRTQLVVQRLGLRFDGPTAGVPRAHAVDRLTLLLGATGVPAAAAGAVFAANLSQPLTAALRDVRLSYTTDGNAVPGPEPFGGAAGELTFLLPQPTVIAVPSGGAFALELQCEGNDNAGDSAGLDLFVDPANFLDPGWAASNGRGCPLGAALSAPVLDTLGSYEPGGSIGFFGHSFVPASPVAILVTAHLFASPLAFPNTTPICWAYVDPGSTLVSVLTTASSGGGVSGGEPLPIPKQPAPAGAVIYVQSATPVVPFSGNGFGVASSNYRTIRIGGLKLPTAGAWVAASTTDARARVATAAFYGALALRLE